MAYAFGIKKADDHVLVFDFNIWACNISAGYFIFSEPYWKTQLSSPVVSFQKDSWLF